MRILGIDPGSVATGWGVVASSRASGTLEHVAHGTLRPPRAASLPVRLAHIHRGLLEVIDRFAPETAAIEGVFLARNPRSALVLGQARGAAMTALGSAQSHDLPRSRRGRPSIRGLREARRLADAYLGHRGQVAPPDHRRHLARRTREQGHASGELPVATGWNELRGVDGAVDSERQTRGPHREQQLPEGGSVGRGSTRNRRRKL